MGDFDLQSNKRLTWVAAVWVIILAIGVVWSATQTRFTVPDNNETFMTDLQNFLRNELPGALGDALRDFVIFGGTAPTSANLTHTVAGLKAMVNGYYVDQAATAITYMANRRSYVYATDLDTGTPTVTGGNGCTFVQRLTRLIVIECLSESNEPVISGVNVMPVLYVDTSSTAITAVGDLRPSNALTDRVLLVTDPIFGAVPDDGLDDLAALNAVISRAKAQRRKVTIVFPPGEYHVSNTWVIDAPQIHIKAARGGQGASTKIGVTLISTNSNADTMQILNTRDVVVDGLRLQHTAATTSVYELRVTNSAWLQLDNLTMFGSGSTIGNCLRIEETASGGEANVFNVRIDRLMCADAMANGIIIRGNDVNRQVIDVHITHAFITAAKNVNVFIDQWTQGVRFYDSDISVGGSAGVGGNVLVNASGSGIQNLFFEDVVFDAPVGNCNFCGGNATGVFVRNSWVGTMTNATQQGIRGESGANGWHITNNYLLSNAGGGIGFNGTGSHFSGNWVFCPPGFESNAPIRLLGNSTNNFVNDTYILSCTGGPVDDNSVNGGNSIGSHKVVGDKFVRFGSPIKIAGTALASLGTPNDGAIAYCSDCTPNTSPCAGAGAGAFAFRIGGVWVCANLP